MVKFVFVFINFFYSFCYIVRVSNFKPTGISSASACCFIFLLIECWYIPAQLVGCRVGSSRFHVARTLLDCLDGQNGWIINGKSKEDGQFPDEIIAPWSILFIQWSATTRKETEDLNQDEFRDDQKPLDSSGRLGFFFGEIW